MGGIFSRFFGFSKQGAKIEITDFSMQMHDEYYRKGCQCIEPYMKLHQVISKKPDENKIKQGLQYLDAVTKINPQNWAAFWIKGKGYQALGNDESAYFEFSKSFGIEKNNPDVARELMFACLNTQRTEEGIKLAEHALSLHPKNAGLMGNLSLAYLINKDLDKAEKTAQEAIAIDAQDQINKRVLNIIKEVKTGKRRQPGKYSDLV